MREIYIYKHKENLKHSNNSQNSNIPVVKTLTKWASTETCNIDLQNTLFYQLQKLDPFCLMRTMNQ